MVGVGVDWEVETKGIWGGRPRNKESTIEVNGGVMIPNVKRESFALFILQQ